MASTSRILATISTMAAMLGMLSDVGIAFHLPPVPLARKGGFSSLPLVSRKMAGPETVRLRGARSWTTTDAGGLKSAASDNDDEGQSWDSLVEWGAEQGIWCPGWTVQTQPSGDRSAIATEDIEEGAVLCRTPRMCAWVVTAREPPRVPTSFLNPGYWLSADLVSDKGWFLKLAAKLLYEKHLGIGSKWFPYIQALPEHIDTLVHWSDKELQELQSPRLQEEVQQSQAWLEKAYAEFSEALSLAEPIPFAEFRWALDCVRSRTFSAGGRWAMLPVGDMFNHASEARESRFVLNELLDTFDILSGGPVHAGEEVRISYGSLTNNKLLAFYAFTEDDNPWDSLSVPEDDVVAFFAACAREDAAATANGEEEEGGGPDLWERRVAVVEALRRYKYLPPAPARYHVLAGGEVEPELELLVEALSLPPYRLLASPDSLALQIGERAPPPADPMAFPPPPSPAAIKAAVAAGIADLALHLQEEAATTLAEDCALLEGLEAAREEARAAPSRLERAVRFRRGKKRLLGLVT